LQFTAIVRWSALGDACIRTFLAPVCAACERTLDRPLAGTICDACWRSVRRLGPPLCAVCGDALAGFDHAEANAATLCGRCRATAPSFSIARSAGCYEGSFRAIIHALKYQARRALAAPIARLMRDAAGDVLIGADALIPVPLHPWRALGRGFNQADDLAVHLGAPVWRALRRRRHGPPQASLPAGRRLRNVHDAFACGPLFGLLAPYWARRLEGRAVVLVDDVMTTGQTIEACAQVLKGAGVRDVRALTAARAVAARPPLPIELPRRARLPR
jgi:ComF family protein